MATDRKPVRVLHADHELAAKLDDQARSMAERHAIAEALRLEPGSWDPREDVKGAPGDLGVLVLDGLLKRRVEVAGSACAELLGQGDLLRPWQEDAGWEEPGLHADWEVLEPTWLAVLDRRFAAIVGHWPEVLDVLMARTVQRSRTLAFHMALSHLTRVDVRLLALFWHLADRWGRVAPDGVLVPLHLTHQTLAALVGAQRPSVTTALGGLADSGRVTRRDDGAWVLPGEPPAELGAPGAEAPVSASADARARLRRDGSEAG
ncbi:MAG: family transcriptional regulator, cyclic receptor protein [Solirubrobacteraceae bacterium]|jgi:hypothetical protein|nr:family transcriptional regulator, cyclic receptor protein [Solirubrobacteraceae bacterium]